MGKGENQVTALDHVSLTIEKGEFTAIIGSFGSGKSTLLHIIGGVDVPTSEKVYLDGQDVYAQSNEKLAIFRRRHVGLIYQFHNLISTLNVVENITLPILMDKRKVNEERLNDLLEMLGLKDRKMHLPNQLSGGQQQRVSIGRALMNAPAVMLADEPTGSLDSRNGHEIIKLLKLSHKKYSQSLIVVTHDENIALQADRMDGNKNIGQHDPYISGEEPGKVKETLVPKAERTYTVVGICERPGFEEHSAPDETVYLPMCSTRFPRISSCAGGSLPCSALWGCLTAISKR